MAEYRIHGRIERIGADTYIAKVGISPLGDGAATADNIAEVCHPCTLEDIRQACERFIRKLERQLAAEGHRVVIVQIEDGFQ